jgi:hypothetical protein
MRWTIQPALILAGCLLLAGGLVPPCGAEDYVAKQGIALYRVELENLAAQVLKLGEEDEDQRHFLDRLFQMKFGDAEKMFQMFEDSPEVKRVIAELHVLKAVEADAMGNWIQAYFSLKDAASWNRQVMSQSLELGGKAFNITAFSHDLENKALQWGNQVRFVIRPFPSDRMFRPEKVVLGRSEEEPEMPAARSGGGTSRARTMQDPSSPGGRWDTEVEALEQVEISSKDKAYVLDRFSKALYAYYYNPIEKNATFDLFLPRGEYYVYEKDFMVHPVDFEVSEEKTQVILRPARWFRLTVSDQVHPSNVHLSFHGAIWKDFSHVPFGSYRVHVKSNEYTASSVWMTFVPEKDAASKEEARARKGKIVEVSDRGEYELSLRPRTGNEKLRYSLLGF